MQKLIEAPSIGRQQEFTAAVKRSRKLHHPWVQVPDTPETFKSYLKRYESPSNLGYFIQTESGELAGVINISEIVRGLFRSGYLGYYAFVPHHNSGYMTRGLRAVV